MTELCYPQPHVRESACEAAGHVFAARLAAAEAALAAAEAEVERLTRFAQDFWQPVVRDLEHGIMSFETVRFMAQDYLAALDPEQETVRAPEGER